MKKVIIFIVGFLVGVAITVATNKDKAPASKDPIKALIEKCWDNGGYVDDTFRRSIECKQRRAETKTIL